MGEGGVVEGREERGTYFFVRLAAAAALGSAEETTAVGSALGRVRGRGVLVVVVGRLLAVALAAVGIVAAVVVGVG